MAALIAIRQRKPALGVDLLDRAITLKADVPSVYCNRGVALKDLNQLGAALDSYDRAIALDPNYAAAHNNRGVILRMIGRREEALASFDRAIAIDARYAEAYSNRGVVLTDLGRLDEAAVSIATAIELRPTFADAYNSLGTTLREAKRLGAALACYERAIRLQPAFPAALNNRGNVLRELGRLQEALASYDQALAVDPGMCEAHANRGNILKEWGDLEGALACFERSLAINPRFVSALSSRGAALASLRRVGEAIESCEQAIAIAPKYFEAYNNLGNALRIADRPEEAIASYDQALALNPEYAMAHHNRGIVLQDIKRFSEAIESFDRALKFEPHYEFLAGVRLHAKMQICDWRNFEKELAGLTARINEGAKATVPFPVLGLTDSGAVQLKAAEIYVDAKYPPKASPLHRAAYPRSDKIRVGYYSADFHNHATMHLMAEVFEKHNRDRFELYAFSFGPDTRDEMRQRLEMTVDRFVDAREKSDVEIAMLSREARIDIGIDLKGLTVDCRTGVFALRAAPIQVNFLGYPGTLGAPYFDYVIADKTLIPAELRRYFRENVVYLPDSYQPNDSRRSIDPEPRNRAELGLPERGFVYCCFNNNYKITPATFDAWMQILERVPGSVIWLLEDNGVARDNLQAEAVRRGIDAARLVFAPRVQFSQHLARHRVADLFLDTLPYNAHTTASDALFTGLPVLTCLGQAFAGRVAGSLVRAVGLDELVVEDRGAYIDLAVELARQPEMLQSLRRRLDTNKKSIALFDMDRYTRHLEQAYLEMYERFHAGLEPDVIEVARYDG